MTSRKEQTNKKKTKTIRRAKRRSTTNLKADHDLARRKARRTKANLAADQARRNTNIDPEVQRRRKNYAPKQ